MIGGSANRASLAQLARDAVAAGRPICLEGSVLIDYLATKEPVASLIDPFLRAPDQHVMVSPVSSTEMLTRPAHRNSRSRLGAILGALLTLPRFQVVSFDQAHAIEAAIVRAQTGLKLPDAAIVATARLADALALIGNDRQWVN